MSFPTITIPTGRDIADFERLEAEVEQLTGMDRNTKTVINKVDEFWAATAPGAPA